MVIELREKGDNLVLFTNDKLVYKNLSKWKCLLDQVPYFNKNGKKVAADLYFDKSLKNVLLEVLKGQLVLHL